MSRPSSSGALCVVPIFIRHAWAMSIAVFMLLAAVVRVHLLVLPSRVLLLSFSVALCLYCIASTAGVFLYGREMKRRRLTLSANIVLALVWAAIFFGTLTFPVQR